MPETVVTGLSAGARGGVVFLNNCLATLGPRMRPHAGLGLTLQIVPGDDESRGG